jgi:hypothetical protein
MLRFQTLSFQTHFLGPDGAAATWQGLFMNPESLRQWYNRTSPLGHVEGAGPDVASRTAYRLSSSMDSVIPARPRPGRPSPQYLTPEHVGRSSNGSDLYSEGIQFDSRPPRISWGILMIFLKSLQVNFEYYVKWRHDCFLPNPYQLIII